MSDSRLLRRIVDPVRRLYAEDMPEPELWSRISDVLEAAMADPELQAVAQSWPKSHDRTNTRYTNLLLVDECGQSRWARGQPRWHRLGVGAGVP